MLPRLAAAVLVAVALAACSDDPPAEAPAAGGGAGASMNCGDAVEALVARADPNVSLDGTFPARVSASAGTFSGTVTLTARQRLAGTASPYPDVIVVRDGVVVARPMDKDDVGTLVDLAPGGTRAFEAVGSVTTCDGPGAALAPGPYQVYAVVSVWGEAGPGSEVVAVGGPWPVEIRP